MAEPVPESPAVTPGQAAYEAWWADAEPAWYEPWGELPPHARQRWEASAEAVAAPLRAENERLRAALRELAASWAEPVKMATATHDEIVEQVEREECARALLAVLGEASHA